MQIGYIKTRFLFNLGNRPEHVNPREFGIIRLPYRNWRSPEAVTGNRPVTRAFQPFAETAVFDVFRHPVNLLIVLNHVITEIRYFDKPAGHRFINQRGICPPAERIRVGILFFFDKYTFFFQQLHNRFIGFKNLFALIIRHFGSEFAGFVNRADDREIFIISAAGIKVVLTKARGNMNNARTVFGRYKLAAQYLKCPFIFQVFKVREHRLIAHAYQFAALQSPNLCGVFQLLFVAAEQSLRQDIFLPVFFHNGIVNIFADSQH